MYDGYPRTVEPHCYGESRAGNELLRCYQVAGGSSSGNVPDWKLMTVDKISGLALTQKTFLGPRPEYNRDDKAMHTIYVQL